jgi:hypothetical protein
MHFFPRCRLLIVCLVFSSHRRAQKAADTNDPKHMKIQDDDGASDDEEDPESEEGVDDGMEQGRDTRRPADPYRSGVRHHHSTQQQHYQQPQYHNHQRVHQHVKPRSSYPSSSVGKTNGHANGYRSHHRELAPTQSHDRPLSSSSGRGMHGVEMNEEDMDAEGDVYPERGGGISRRPHPTVLADIDSPRGRLVNSYFYLQFPIVLMSPRFRSRTNFIHSSIVHLFRTTYDPTDELSVSTLLSYLNAAVPQDKHEDYDMGELVKALGSLRDGGRLTFEGDVVGLTE